MKKLVLLLLLFLSSLAFSQMPSIISSSSSLPTSTTIRIDYAINANGSNTTVVIKYGLTQTNLTQIFNCPDVSGNNLVNQFSIVSGDILSATTYYYAIEATNSSGTVTRSGTTTFGVTIPFQFTTTSPANLPVISNVHVISLLDGGARIGYTVNPNGFSTVTYTQSYILRNGYFSGSGTGPTVTGTTPVSASADTGFGDVFFNNVGATIYFKVYAINSIGAVASAEGQSIIVYRPNFGPGIAFSATTTGATIYYTLNPNGGNSTSVFRYGTSLGSYPNSVAGTSASGFTPTSGTATANSLTPGTTYYWVLEATNEYGTTQSDGGVFTTNQIPIFTNISSSNITTTSATINYSISPFSSSAAITPVIRYGTDANNLNLSQNCTPVQGLQTYSQTQNLTGLTSGVTYFYRVEATNSTGLGGNLATPSQFTTVGTVTSVPSPIYNFEFNNSLVSQDGLVTMGTPWPNTVTYVSDGTNSDGALQFNEDRNITELSTLPLGTTSRSVHFRIKYAANALTSENRVFTYGKNVAGEAFSFSQTATTAKFVGSGTTADFTATVATSTGVWYEYMLVYNGTSITIYRDGVSLGSQNVTLNTSILVNNPNFLRIGQSVDGIAFLKADLDYFRVFNTALTPLEVAFINNNPTVLSSQNFNQNNLEVSLYPNPANDVLNIEMTNEVKSIEIYTIQGQKVKSANQKQINVSDLAAGMYMIRIQDADNAVSTKKFLKQ